MEIIDFLEIHNKETQANETWVIAKTEEDGLPILHRFRQCVPDGVSFTEYPYLLSILWQYKTEDDSGMPSDEQNQQHLNFEDALDVIDRKGNGTIMIATTGNGRKEWIWYVNDPKAWLNELHLCLQGHPVYPLDIEKTEDTEWKTWKAFRDYCK